MKHLFVRRIRIPYDFPCHFEHLGEKKIFTASDKERLIPREDASSVLANISGLKNYLLK
jgi:hypothetical protein